MNLKNQKDNIAKVWIKVYNILMKMLNYSINFQKQIKIVQGMQLKLLKVKLNLNRKKQMK